MTTVRDLRTDYATRTLSDEDVGPDPLIEIAKWVDFAVKEAVPEPNAITLSTIGEGGMPASRIVLVRGIDARGLSFFTHYTGAKGRELARDPRVAGLFFWPALERQLRVAGSVEKLAPEASDAYFAGRPRKSQLGAWASHQSDVIASRAELEASFAEAEKRFGEGEVPRPPLWGGYVLVPTMVELWQGRPSRLHDRLRYDRRADGWSRVRLAP